MRWRSVTYLGRGQLVAAEEVMQLRSMYMSKPYSILGRGVSQDRSFELERSDTA